MAREARTAEELAEISGGDVDTIRAAFASVCVVKAETPEWYELMPDLGKADFSEYNEE